MSSLDYLDLCRLCLVKDRVSVPIFGGEGNDLFLKIAACLPVKVGREDKLPKKICDDCVYKVELFYEFWNTTANAEKRLLQWLGEVNVESGKQGYVPNVLNPNVMKQEQSTENRLDGSVMQQVGEHQNNMGMSMMDNMGLGIPMMIPNTNQQQQITSVPMDTSGSPAQNVQAVPGPSSQTTHNQISQNQTSSTQQEDEEESSEDDENSDDECDGDEGLPVKEESEEDPNSRTIEPTTFVNVSLACDEAGPSGLQQQKITDMPEMPISQSADGDPKTGFSAVDPLRITASEKRFCQIKAKSASTCRAKLNGEPTSGKTIVNRSCDNLPCARRSIETVEKTQSNEIQRKTPKAPVKCDHCGEQFRRKSQLTMHMKTYKYDCDYCEKAFRLIRDLRLHCKDRHGAAETRMHRCTGCEYKTSNKASLRDHVTRKHTNNYPHGCPICLKKFKLKTDLRQHTRQVHSDAPAVICPVCGNSYKSNNSLTHHMRSCHNKHPFKCSMCKRCLSTQKILDQHMLWHKERERMVCPICGKTILSSIIDRHMRMHTGVKPHQCPVCAKSFSRQSAMEQHVLIHTGKKPYICDICGQAFTQKPGLICHRKRHEGPLPQLPVMSVKDIVQEFTKKYSTKKTIVNND